MTTISIPYPVSLEFRDVEYHCEATDCYGDEVSASHKDCYLADCYLALGLLQVKLAAKKTAAQARTEEIKKLTDEALQQVLQSYDPPVEISYNGDGTGVRKTTAVSRDGLDALRTRGRNLRGVQVHRLQGLQNPGRERSEFGRKLAGSLGLDCYHLAGG